MKLLLKREWKKDSYTIGNLYIDGQWLCNTLEDKDRGFNNKMSMMDIKTKKVKGETAIPTGTYDVTLKVISPRFSKKEFYYSINGGRVPRLLGVKGFDGVLIHAGNKAEDTEGCILVGLNKIKGKLIKSQETYTKLYRLLQSSKDKIIITIE